MPAVNFNTAIPKAVDDIASTIQTMSVSRPDVPSEGGEVTCWLVDTRKLWPGSNIWSADGAAEAMSLISTKEQTAIASKMFIQDARMSLASALVKRLYITRTLDIPWKQIHLGRRGDPKHGKPCAVDAKGRAIDGIDFNVSHQAGLVTLVGWDGKIPHTYNVDGGVDGELDPATYQPDVQVGTDIVCVNERDEYRLIDSEGLDQYIDMYDYVFSDEQRWTMKYDVDYITLPDGATVSGVDLGRHDRCIQRNKPISLVTPAGKSYRFNSNVIVESKLRRFYTYFCYMEAYVKLAGEALLAPWLKDLEFFNVRSPKAGSSAFGTNPKRQWGEQVEDVEVQMKGKPVDNVRMTIQSFEEKFMISTAVQGKVRTLRVPAFRSLDLRGDIMDIAEDYFF